MFKKTILLLLLISLFTFTFSQSPTGVRSNYKWAKIQLEKMSLEQKIAQLMIVRVRYTPEDTNSKIIKEIAEFQPGGVCFFKGTPYAEVLLTNQMQKVSNIPLLVTIDGEWGAAMRLDSVIRFPRQITLGALDAQYDHLIYEMGKEIAAQCVALGITINFAPDIDINNNHNNPVINSRSFGENKDLVVAKAWQYLQGMQSGGVMGCVKHFPGHGDTETDSHFALPVINKTKKELENMELYPFQQFINKGVRMVMVSPLNVPALDTADNSIALLSHDIITKLLKEEMSFKGIVITDGMEMNGLRNSYPGGGEAEIQALIAGNDILLLPESLSIVIPAICKAVADGRITEQQIDEKCLKVLQLKEDLDNTHFKTISTRHLSEKLNAENAQNIINQIESKAMTLVKNENVLPLQRDGKTIVLCLGDSAKADFFAPISQRLDIPFIHLNKNITKKRLDSLFNQISVYQNVVVAIQETNQTPSRKYGVNDGMVELVQNLARQKRVILSIFGSPYIIERFKNTDSIPVIIIGYQDTYNTLEVAMDGIFGYHGFEGRLPVTTGKYAAGTGIITQPSYTLNALSETCRIAKIYEHKIDSVALQGIKDKIYPGCQVLAIHNDEVIFYKNYGYLSYNQMDKVNENTLYDLASITKSAATTLAVMKLYDEEKIDLHAHLGDYLPEVIGSNKESLTIAELLTHTSGLPAYIPFYKKLANDSIRYLYINDISNDEFTVPVANHLYLNSAFQKEIEQTVMTCNLKNKHYLYSDLGFFYLQKIIERLTGKTLDEFVNENFYRPMQLTHLCFNPLNYQIPLSQIAPTENDTEFRGQVVHGYVHDQLAALYGGVCGNAGLFGNADDLSQIYIMLLNHGVYREKQYLRESTVKKFIHTYSLHGCSSRALGFHTPSYEKKSDILPKMAGKHTFGHQGFTGTVVWCDPDQQIIYIFLSNRVYPDVEPNKLSKSKIRLILHDIIYQAVADKMK